MGFISDLNEAQQFINNNSAPLTEDQRRQYQSNGFMLPPSFSSDGSGLPYTKVKSGRRSQIKRNIITWFIPEFGTVRMYVNPESIVYRYKKVIGKERTKGGYVLQYWGEELPQLDISGTTGSSGIEGINMLYEIYRAEQYAFDPIGLTLAANNANMNFSTNVVNSIAEKIGTSEAGTAGTAGLIGGILGLDSPNNNLAPRNIPSLAQLAFTVEMYYNGIVYRGFFDSMSVTEKASSFVIDYQITFYVTQIRGYRTNYFPFHRSAKDGPSRYDTDVSLSGYVTTG
jgi:hypothetical protein